MQTNEDSEIETEDSYDSETILYNKKQTDGQRYDICKSPTLKSPTKRKVEEGKTLKWTAEEAMQRELGGLPQIKGKYSVNQLPN